MHGGRTAIIENGVKLQQSSYRAVIERFLNTQWRSESEIVRAYRKLCKDTHPDLTGLSSDAFVAVQEAFAEALARVQRRTEPAGKQRPFSVYDVIRESGYPTDLPPRACFLIALMRYTNLGLYSFRIRRHPGLQRRNAGVVRAVRYWAEQYDSSVMSLFDAFDETQLRSLASTAEMQRYHRARRMLLDGLHSFFQYQRSGRTTTGQVAADRLRYGIAVLEAVAPEDSSLGLAARLVEELSGPPIVYYSDRPGARPRV